MAEDVPHFLQQDESRGDLVNLFHLDTRRVSRTVIEHEDGGIIEQWQREDTSLGAGGFSEAVWLEKELGGKLRVVKQVRKVRGDVDEKYWVEEIRAMAYLSRNSKNFPAFYGWFQDPAFVYIALEYFTQGDLQKCVQQPLGEFEARKITLQIAKALEFMHYRNLTHRDLKPDNIFVRRAAPAWHVALADFSVAKLARSTATEMKTSISGAGDFRAPEILDESTERYTSAVDIWGLGCITYWLLTLRAPIHVGKIALYCYLPWDKARAMIDTTKISENLRNLIFALLKPEPSERATAKEIIAHEWCTDTSLTFTDHTTQSASNVLISGVSPGNTGSTTVVVRKPVPTSTQSTVVIRSTAVPSESTKTESAQRQVISNTTDVNALSINNFLAKFSSGSKQNTSTASIPVVEIATPLSNTVELDRDNFVSDLLEPSIPTLVTRGPIATVSLLGAENYVYVNGQHGFMGLLWNQKISSFPNKPVTTIAKSNVVLNYFLVWVSKAHLSDSDLLAWQSICSSQAILRTTALHSPPPMSRDLSHVSKSAITIPLMSISMLTLQPPDRGNFDGNMIIDTVDNVPDIPPFHFGKWQNTKNVIEWVSKSISIEQCTVGSTISYIVVTIRMPEAVRPLSTKNSTEAVGTPNTSEIRQTSSAQPTQSSVSCEKRFVPVASNPFIHSMATHPAFTKPPPDDVQRHIEDGASIRTDAKGQTLLSSNKMRAARSFALNRQTEGYLSFEKGDVITVNGVSLYGSGWYYGTLDDRHGHFVGSDMEPFDESELWSALCFDGNPMEFLVPGQAIATMDVHAGPMRGFLIFNKGNIIQIESQYNMGHWRGTSDRIKGIVRKDTVKLAKDHNLDLLTAQKQGSNMWNHRTESEALKPNQGRALWDHLKPDFPLDIRFRKGDIITITSWTDERESVVDGKLGDKFGKVPLFKLEHATFAQFQRYKKQPQDATSSVSIASEFSTFQVQAIYNNTYPPEKGHEHRLEFVKGDIITVIGEPENSSDCWIGTLDGRRGIFSKAWVKRLDRVTPVSSEVVSKQSEDLPKSESLPVVWDYPPRMKVQETATALFDFNAENEEDITFRAGDGIRVLERTDSTYDWWIGQVAGGQNKTGTFPGNYVTLPRGLQQVSTRPS